MSFYQVVLYNHIDYFG